MYSLLPFTYTKISEKEVIVNELGDMMAVPIGTVKSIVSRTLDPESELYKSLVANFFISEQRIPALLDIYAERLAEKKRFMDDRTALHIFVLTLRCNQNCIYCQATSQDEKCTYKSMSFETMKNSVELMFKSPSKWITMEFQGGEPSLEPKLLKYGIELAEEINKEKQKNIRYVLCTNSINLTDEILDICKNYHVVISTSLDGPMWLHNQNRGKMDSYQKVIKGIEKARKILGKDQVSALMTPRNCNIRAIVTPYLGPKYTNDEIINILKNQTLKFTMLSDSELYEKVSKHISEGKIVGWFQDKMEFGPRALGNRSILADPRNAKMKNIINAKVKFRESFRPFAPIVIKEDASRYFSDNDSPYMMFTAKVVKDCNNIPAVTHLDRTSRVQTVTKEQNEQIYSLLQVFKSKTGCSVLLNTSFNIMGEPIVCSPYDAVKTYIKSGIDILVINQFLIVK